MFSEGTDALPQECLEAEFYSYAVYGHGLSTELLGGGPGSVGGQQATFLLESTKQYATEIANDEINHVAVLRQILGSAAGADSRQHASREQLLPAIGARPQLIF